MGFSSFRANVLMRVGLLVGLCWVVVWSILAGSLLATPVACGVLIVIGTVELIRYVEKTASELRVFLSSVAHHDYSTPAAPPHKGRVFAQLQEAYRMLAGEFRRLNLQKAANLEYLEAVFEHVGVALCCFDGQGLVRMFNEPARRLFGLPYLHSRQTLARVDERLPDLIGQLGSGERTLLSVRRGDDVLQLLLYATEFTLMGQRYKLVSFQNIRGELDRQEVDSWQKLIRILTHEIMNSVTPITSLSRLLRDTLIDESGTPPAFRTLLPQQQSDVLRGIAAIESRSSGLLDFVRAYRSFAILPSPQFADVEVRDLLERVRTLMSQEMEADKIALELRYEDQELRISVDAGQIEQVLINLVRNALDALAGRPAPRIVLRGARAARDEILLQVIDNGSGIAPEHLDNIFVPFFTTKRQGTGVGLAVSRQLVQMNGGLISVRSEPGEGSTFTLKFPEPRPEVARVE